MRFLGSVRYSTIRDILKPACRDPDRLECLSTLLGLFRLFLHFYFTGFLNTRHRLFEEIIDTEREEYDDVLDQIEASFNHVLFLRDHLSDAEYSTVPGDQECSIYVERGESVMFEPSSILESLTQRPLVDGDTKTLSFIFSVDEPVLWNTLRGFESQGVLPESFIDSVLAKRLNRPKPNRLRDLRSRRFLDLDSRQAFDQYLGNSTLEIEWHCGGLLESIEEEIHRVRIQLFGPRDDRWNFTCVELRVRSSICATLVVVVHEL